MGTSEVGNDVFRCILSDAGIILSNHDANLLFQRVRGPSGHTRIYVLLLIDDSCCFSTFITRHTHKNSETCRSRRYSIASRLRLYDGTVSEFAFDLLPDAWWLFYWAGLANLACIEAVLKPLEEVAAPSQTESVLGFGTGSKLQKSKVLRTTIRRSS